jgi:hypothetical protein
MRTSCCVFLSLLAAPLTQIHGQDKVITPDLSALAVGKGWTVHNASAEAVKADGKAALRLKA